MQHPKFEVKKGSDEKLYFNLTAKNGQVILSSQGYKSKHGCEKAIESVRKNAQMDKRFERKISKDRQLYFVLKARNGEVIGKSEMYSVKAAMEQGVISVKENAQIAVAEFIA
ncbi:MAG: YegP family protein [Bacteroidales bacterium]|nr:YegP family protein [Bacteroidales bacterium]